MSTLSQLDIAALRLLIAIADHGSISAGANRRHLSVAAASKRISDLEARVGMALLLRHRRGVKPTPAGEIFIAHARRMAALAGAMEDDLRDYANGVEDRVRIVANSAAIVQFLPEDLHGYMQGNPRVRIELEEHTSRSAVELLQTDRADLGLFDGGYAAANVHCHPYRADTLVCVTHPRHSLARRRGALRFEQTLEHDHVGLYRGTAILTQMERAAAQAGRMLRLRIQVTSFDAVCRMAESGIGVGVVPARVAQSYVTLGRLRQIRLSDPWARRQLMLGWPQQREPSPGAQALIAHLLTSTQP
ncbi:LysR family transcriptional regulator [Bordetella hinzii]|uniref:LysR family transcriptional regulator n=2 Tax=Bordetella hinzii TaxID=103855 RepID=A0AAN1RWT8_9BORD|nr:LysR family transcriptional regulator [Bordetella hinzii]AKQ57023.1 HTH-type transcriptional regulator BenM [Bordetella hinzii]AKQ61489.1 HTH-type transcriptional regulator BenM [Bordetella hinzii]AZW17544.1 LysR family transcriptional regulator [Bordetella hinzii]KCB23874.1 LysR substrate-binding domain protein [Bordetella hinzii OH87 BAL007II]KCB27262.1 LysR substrate-binding domain protein [Bordetella hinzii L60]